jgi:hypothetical protein
MLGRKFFRPLMETDPDWPEGLFPLWAGLIGKGLVQERVGQLRLAIGDDQGRAFL